MHEYYVEQLRGYIVTSNTPLSDEEVQELVEDGLGSLKVVEWNVTEN